MAELFKSVGYNTAIAGKWHVGQEEQSRPVNQGFDEYKVGVLNSSDGAYYRGHMERMGLPEKLIAGTAPKIWEGDSEERHESRT